jgi:hypothetical protein
MSARPLRFPGKTLGLLGLLLLTGVLLPTNASAQIKHCQPIVKKIYSTYEGPPFYKAKVLIVSGSEVTCLEARKVIWRSFQPGGFNGIIRGWQCKSSIGGGGEKEKCWREDPREVIKSGPAKPCPQCHANRN